MISPIRAGVALGAGLLVTHGFGLSLVPALLPRISDSLETGYAELGIAVASGLASYSIGAIASARLLERLPNRSLLLATLAVPMVALFAVAQGRSGVAIGVAVAVLGANAGASWPVSLHVLAQTIPASSRTQVMSGAGAGVGFGMIVNGVLVQLAGDTLSWQSAILVAAGITVIPIVLVIAVFRYPIPRPPRTAVSAHGFQTALSTTVGRIIFLAGLSGGLLGFPLVAFLSVIAQEEMAVSASRAALLWWLVGVAGIIVSPLFGRLGQQRGPLYAMTAGALVFLLGLVVLVASWSYLALAFSAVALTAYYYPVWGLVGSMASDAFDSGIAVRSVAVGLVGASIGGAIGNASAGAWYDASGSFRGVVLVMVVGIAITASIYIRVRRDSMLTVRVEGS